MHRMAIHRDGSGVSILHSFRMLQAAVFLGSLAMASFGARFRYVRRGMLHKLFRRCVGGDGSVRVCRDCWLLVCSLFDHWQLVIEE
jgi:hypothetical protein